VTAKDLSRQITYCFSTGFAVIQVPMLLLGTRPGDHFGVVLLSVSPPLPPRCSRSRSILRNAWASTDR